MGEGSASITIKTRYFSHKNVTGISHSVKWENGISAMVQRFATLSISDKKLKIAILK